MAQPKAVREVRDKLFTVMLTGTDIYTLTQRLKKDAIQLECFDDIEECVHLIDFYIILRGFHEQIMSQARRQNFGLPAAARDECGARAGGLLPQGNTSPMRRVVAR